MLKLAGIVILLSGCAVGLWWGHGEEFGLRVVLVLVAMMFALPIGLALCLQGRFRASDAIHRAGDDLVEMDRKGISIAEIERNGRLVLQRDQSDLSRDFF